MRHASGFFNATQGRNDDGSVSSYRTSFRFLIKHPAPPRPSTGDSYQIPYDWYKLGFSTRWQRSNSSLVLCFDLPTTLRSRLQDALSGVSPRTFIESPFAFHIVALEHVADLFDQSVWSWRDVIRAFEQKRPNVKDPRVEYDRMHEAARHVIHSSETLLVTLNVVEAMIEEHAARYSEEKSSVRSLETGRAFRYHKSLFQCLHVRSQALEERLRNEINLVCI